MSEPTIIHFDAGWWVGDTDAALVDDTGTDET
jgi:hypothetical protein